MNAASEHLTKAAVLVLVAKAQAGDLRARNELIVRHMALVETIARKCRRPKLFADLVQAGVSGAAGQQKSGLVRAIELYKPEGGRSFMSYAYLWIKAAIDEELSLHTPVMRVNRGKLWRAAKVKRRAQQIRAQTGREPPAAAVRAKACAGEQISVEAVADHMAHETPRAVLPTDTQLGAGCEDDAICGLDRERIARVVGTLPMLEAIVVRLRFVDEDTQAIVAKKLRMSREAIKDAERRAIEALRDLLWSEDE